MSDPNGTTHCLRVGFQNVNGLSGKAEATRAIMETAQLDILFIVETWLGINATNPLKDITFVDIRGSKSINGRRTNGGIIGLCRNEKLRPDLKEIDGNGKDWVCIQTQKTSLFIGYFSPKPNNDATFKEFISKANSKEDVLIMGDFNAHHTSLGSSHCNNRGHWLMNETENLTYCHPKKGNFSSNIGQTRPDHCLTNASNVMDDLVIHEDIITLSDHRIMSVSMMLPEYSNTTFTRLDIGKLRTQKYKEIYSMATMEVAESLLQRLNKASWPLNQEKVNSFWDEIKHSIYGCLEGAIGHFKYKKRTNLDFWNEEMHNLKEDVILLQETIRQGNATPEIKRSLQFYQRKMDD
jgi:exonuclease III